MTTVGLGDMDKSALPLGVIEGRKAFVDALRQMLVYPHDPTVRELWLIDDDFEAWPLDEPVVLEALTHWLRLPSHRLHMVGRNFRVLERRCPRFTAWRRQLSHAFEAYQPSEGEEVNLMCCLLAGPQALELLEPEYWRARKVSEPAGLRRMNEKLAVLLHKCDSAWPVTTLGL